MEKAYNHLNSEDEIYAAWEASGAMRADETSSKPPFTIPLPPPNVTGELHLGHAAMLAIQDIMIRYKKMQGHEVLWLPGTDHAAIATENVVIKHHGKTSREQWPSREAFLKDAAAFATEKHDNIVNQMKRMGSWLDWSREAYTFDEPRNFAVNTIFKDLYKDGLIERGHRLINWSTGAQSVISDDELEWDDVKEPFYYIKCGKFIMGTVRPETKCANSPLIVHPDEDYVELSITSPLGGETQRGTENTNTPSTSPYEGESFIIIKRLWDDKEKFFKTLNFLDAEASYEVVSTTKGSDLVGQEFTAETYAGPRDFYVIADTVIDPEKGSGAMTISASHSADDYDLAKRLKLDETFIQKIDFEGNMTNVAGPVAGMHVKKARNVAGKLMEEKGLLAGKDTNYEHRVPLCYRSNCVVEPMISPQWFIMVEKEYTHPVDGKTTLKAQMQAAVRGFKNQDPAVQIIPERFNKEYFRWIDNLQDWCISRQIWWGHRIPVWYDEEGKIVATGFLTPEQEKLNLRQDEDTLDTWFSSALWPFSTLGWPGNSEVDLEGQGRSTSGISADYDKFYHNAVNGQGTDVLETGWDILFFWVARMIMFGRYATNKFPFHTVYLHGMVTDEHGKKMSKSKGNGIDPIGMIEKFGADPVRLALVIGSSPGNPIPIGENKIKGYRNFVNKLWNATRFVGMQSEGISGAPKLSNTEKLSLADEWILSRLSLVSAEVIGHLEAYEISAAGDKIYHFVWDEFCSWYLEASKVEPNLAVLRYALAEILKLTHPLCPFITQKCWEALFESDQVILQNYPAPDFEDDQALTQFETVQNIVNAIRALRAEKNLNPKEKVAASIKSDAEHIKSAAPLIMALGNLSELLVAPTVSKGENVATIVTAGLEIFITVPFDEAAEAARAEKLKAELEQKIAGLKGRLSNPSYTEKAPEHLVAQTRTELEQAQSELEKLS